jgi:hypothetical protein
VENNTAFLVYHSNICVEQLAQLKNCALRLVLQIKSM